MTEEPEKKIIQKTAPVKNTIQKAVPEKKITPVKAVAKIPEIKEAKAPIGITKAGWKDAIPNKPGMVKAKVLKAKSETWDIIREAPIEKRTKGLVIYVYSMEKAGKTNFEQTASRFAGFNGKKRNIPQGWPAYTLDTENAVMDEVEINFYEELKAKKIMVHNCFIEDPKTREVDPIEAMREIEEWSYTLEKEKVGTLIIDNFTDYCDYAYFKMISVNSKSGPGFAEWKAAKKPTPDQQKWQTKKAVEFLRKLRNMEINIILTAQGKSETKKTDDPENTLGWEYTGKIIADAVKKSGFWADVIAVITKDPNDEIGVTRKLTVVDCRFESVNADDGYELIGDQITFTNLINLFKDKL